MFKHLNIVWFIILLLFSSCTQDTQKSQGNSLKGQKESSTVRRVVDGDTFVLENGDRVRLLGIDTPEKFNSGKMTKDSDKSNLTEKAIRFLGEQSSHYADSIMTGRHIYMEVDPLNDNKDRYGRLLRYIYTDDGNLFNLQIILDGYAFAYTKFPITKKDLFVNAENSARENNKGLWKDENFRKLKEQQ